MSNPEDDIVMLEDDQDAGDLGDIVMIGDEAPAVTSAPYSQGEETGIPDWIMSLVDGLTLNNAGEIGQGVLSTGIPQMAARYMPGMPSHEIGGMAPTYVDGAEPVDMERMYQSAEQGAGGRIAKGVGNAITGSASAALAPITYPAQMAAGALTGGLAASGESDDWTDTLTGAGIGSALGGVGAGLSKWLQGQQAALSAPATQPRGMMGVKGPTQTVLAEALSKPVPTAAEQLAEGKSLVKGIYGAADQTAARATLKALAGTPAGAPAAVAGAVAPNVATAYADIPTMIWSHQAALSQPDNGLPEEAKQSLTSVMLTGDAGKIASEAFKLQMRYPKYQKTIEDMLKTVSNGEESGQ